MKIFQALVLAVLLVQLQQTINIYLVLRNGGEFLENKMKIPFQTNHVEGSENVMIIVDDIVREIRYDQNTRAITVVVENSSVFTLEDLDGLSWQALKELVHKNGGEWTSKNDAFDFLIGKSKE